MNPILSYRGANSLSRLDLTCIRNILPMPNLPRALPNLILVPIMFLGTLGCLALGLRVREREVVGHALTHNPQPMHRFRSRTVLPSVKLMAFI